MQRQIALPIEQRAAVLVLWLSDGRPVGFSTADKISFGEQANMHLHVIDPDRRNSGIGAACVRLTVDLYFEPLKLKRCSANRMPSTSRRIGRCKRPASNISRPI